MSKSTITRLINEFEGRGIIDVVKKSSVVRNARNREIVKRYKGVNAGQLAKE